MYLDLKSVKSYLEEIKEINNNLVVCPSTIYLPYFVNNNYQVGIQNISNQLKGAFTGEVSALQAKELGCTYAIVGHSERRQHYHESDDEINQKILLGLEQGLNVILCVGETKEEHDQGKTIERIKQELLTDLNNVKLDQVIIAYEPIWSIGTGAIPTNEEIKDVITNIKAIVKDIYYQDIKVLYGGSVNEININTLNQVKEADGFLLGGVSKEVNKLKQIIEVIERQ